ncbi:Fe-S cluster assembly protein SufD [Leifsonia sp. H3M29-4]|uniref:Fe-S cluster assembly protein SufD n=1 Tax=Salinibacterium metalliresistens TaxID=3031321 RepID=UPI0023DAC18B|nr:Fe-S cluster assembly protein SufD [Salinibacterium metalliresistens]MDF1479885.1 Fe-S cluster assembly protein SufD [Salinibacterium metalliresistens]
MSLLTEGQHGLTAHSDGPVPVQTRSERFTSVDPADFAPVTGLELEWKLTPVAAVRELVEGVLDGAPYEAAGESIEWIPRTDPRIGSAGLPEERASANAWSSFEQALAVTLDSEEHRDVTIHRSGLGTAPRAAHTVITAAPNARGTVILQSTGPAVLSENVEIVVGDGADLTVVSLQEWDDEALHLASHFATVGRGAKLKHIVVSLGGAVVRVNPSVHLAGEGAEGELYGLYFADAGQHIEQRVYLHHLGPNTKGRVNYKGALQGAGARTVWVGDVLIGREASGTDSYEQNRNLVLTEGTRADSIPNLEIETGDILGAGHASATGRFDDEQLFYLQARGIPEAEARRLVVIGFLAEIVQKVGNAELEARLHEAIEQELAGGAR